MSAALSMPFWPVVLASLIGVPALLLFTGMGMIFAAAGLAGGPQESRAKTIVYGWLAFAWILASVFGAFGLAPAWRAWHSGDESFGDGLQVFVDWLVGVGIAVVLGVVIDRGTGASGRGEAGRSPLQGVARTLLLAIAFVPWGAIAGWLVWPLVLWPVHGSFEWPDAATGWTHTAEVTLVLVAAALLEEAVRRRLKR